MEAKAPNLFGFLGKGESPPMGDKRGEIRRYDPVKVSQMEEFTPKGSRERTMDESMVIRFGICKTEHTHVWGQKELGVQRLEPILGESTAPKERERNLNSPIV